jgi:hypothetical protein
MTRPFRNDEPFGCWQAVCLLHRSFGDCTHRTLNTFPREEPCIDVEHYTGPYDSLSSTARFRVTPEAAQWLKEQHLVIGDPYWGGRSTYKFVTTERLEPLYYDTIAPRFDTRTWGRD